MAIISYTSLHKNLAIAVLVSIAKHLQLDTLKTCGLQWVDDEGRFIQCNIQGLLICSLYLPSGTSGDHRQELNMI